MRMYVAQRGKDTVGTRFAENPGLQSRFLSSSSCDRSYVEQMYERMSQAWFQPHGGFYELFKG